MDSEDGVAAAIGKTEHVVLRDLLTKTNATGAENATLIIERDPRPDFDSFGLFDFVFQKTRIGPPIFNTKFLQSAFPGLIADGTVQRMVDQQELHDPATTFLRQGR